MSLPKTLVLQIMGMVSSKYNRRKIFDGRCAVAIGDDFNEREFMLAAAETSISISPARIVIVATDSLSVQYFVKKGNYEITLDLGELLVMTGEIDQMYFINTLEAGDPSRIRVIWA